MKFLIFLFFACGTLYAEPKRVYVDAVADLMHAGHVSLFQRARSYGDTLIVGIHSDETVASYKRKPIMTMQERIAVVEACRYVDEVVPNAPLIITEEYIKEHKIDLVIHGDDFSSATCNEFYGVPLRLGIFQSIPYTQGISTTDLIQRILKAYCVLE
jgi:glycerol-3-phosphate cytidylyltransferase